MKRFEFGDADDFQLKQAVNQLEGKPVQKGELRPVTPEDQKGSVVKPHPPELPPGAKK